MYEYSKDQVEAFLLMVGQQVFIVVLALCLFVEKCRIFYQSIVGRHSEIYLFAESFILVGFLKKFMLF